MTLQNAVKFVVTTSKFDAKGAAKTVNVEADYPVDAVYLRTLLNWSEEGDVTDPRFRDGYDLYCLRRILARQKRFAYAMVLRGAPEPTQMNWPDLQGSVTGRVFLVFDAGSNAGGITAPVRSLLIDLQDSRTTAFLEAASQLYMTGAVYGMTAYSFDGALTIALSAVDFGRSLRHRDEQNITDARPASETLSEPNNEHLMDARQTK